MTSPRIAGLFVLFSILTASHSIALAETQTLTFQDGDGGAYSNTEGASVDLTDKTGSGTETFLIARSWSMDPMNVAFLRFPDLIGDNTGQIPAGSTIESASLRLTQYNATTVYVDLRLVTEVWDENQINGGDGGHPAAVDHVNVIGVGDAGDKVADVTTAVQAWASGTENWGLRLVTTMGVDENYHQFGSDDAAVVAERPLLSVTFTPPPLTPVESSTWGKVKALYR